VRRPLPQRCKARLLGRESRPAIPATAPGGGFGVDGGELSVEVNGGLRGGCARVRGGRSTWGGNLHAALDCTAHFDAAHSAVLEQFLLLLGKPPWPYRRERLQECSGGHVLEHKLTVARAELVCAVRVAKDGERERAEIVYLRRVLFRVGIPGNSELRLVALEAGHHRHA
jgi:hypothetical protein